MVIFLRGDGYRILPVHWEGKYRPNVYLGIDLKSDYTFTGRNFHGKILYKLRETCDR
jgi:hypothetical protein